MIAYWRHRLAHRLGWNMGDVVVWHSLTGRLMVGFRCATCGKVESIAPCDMPRGVQL